MLYAQIDLGALRENLGRIRELLGGTGLLFVVKNDAYGHGLERVATAAAELVDWLGVTSLDEARRIRIQGLGAPILIMTPPPAAELEDVIREGCHFVVGDWEHLREVERAAAAVGAPAFVHVPVDTGMGRYGFLPEEVEGLLVELSHRDGVMVAGIYSHLSAAHSPDADDIAFSRAQIHRFRRLVERLTHRGLRVPFIHVANSAGLLSFPETSVEPFNLVRVGTAAYGYVDGFWRRWGLSPVSQVWGKIVAVRDLPPGWPVGYERGYVTRSPTRLAILGAGYAHGVSEHFRWVWVNGRPAPLIGKAGMDSVALDVTGIPGVKRGSEAILFDGTGENISGWILPALTPVLSRAKKTYVGTPVAARD